MQFGDVVAVVVKDSCKAVCRHFHAESVGLYPNNKHMGYVIYWKLAWQLLQEMAYVL